jgi:hypothetical protein
LAVTPRSARPACDIIDAVEKAATMPRYATRILGCGLLLLAGLLLAQKPFREYPGREYGRFPLPADWQQPGEWVFARLMYPDFGGYGRRGRFRGGYGDWRQGYASWTTDYPRSERHLVMAMRRLTRIHTRAVEQPVNVEDGEPFDWPWLYAVEVGHWQWNDDQAKALREYLLRGGFLMVDDFHGSDEWAVFEAGMRRIFPDRPIVEIDNADAIFHVIYDLDDRYQVPGAQYLWSGRTFEGYDGAPARWRGIYDEKRRLMVAIVFNSDLGDSWEWADDPRYDEKFSALGIRIAVNYVAYSMTH